MKSCRMLYGVKDSAHDAEIKRDGSGFSDDDDVKSF